MKSIKSVNVGSFVLYGAVLAAFWTFVFGLIYWIMGWIFGAQSWWIDMNLANWTVYNFATFLTVFWRSLVNASWRRSGRPGCGIGLQRCGRHDGRDQN